jgi:hypothetical protein
MDPGIVISLIALGGGGIAFLVGLLQYRHAQRWKRAEFVANEIKEFKADPSIHNALLMLDWNERAIELFPREVDPTKRSILVDDESLALALVPHTIRCDFTPLEIALRDTFDRLFDRLERFEYFLQAGLVTREEFEPYLIYWLDLLGNENNGRKAPVVVRAIWRYVEFYYAGVTNLLGRYGYDIRSQESRSEDGERDDVERR